MPKKSNGDGSVSHYQLKDGSIRYDVWITYRDAVTGERKRHRKKGFKTKQEANEYRRKKTAEVDQQVFVKPSNQPFGVYLDAWLEGHRVKQQTKEGYRNKIRLHVKPHIGRTPLNKISSSVLNKLYRVLETKGSPAPALGPLSPRTVREIHTILSAALNQAVQDGVIVANPAAKAKPPTTKEAAAPEFHVWSAEELRAFLHAERQTLQYPLWLFIASTGVRRGEALGLRWRDIDWDNQTAVIRETVGAIRGKIIREPLPKSNKPRVIDLDRRTLDALKAHKSAQAADRLKLGSQWVDEGLVFARGSHKLMDDQTAGGPLHPERTSRLFKARLAKHGLPDVRLHDLRHTWATLALKAGVPVKVVQERLGHANPSITMNIYAHVIKGMQAEAAETVSALFA